MVATRSQIVATAAARPAAQPDGLPIDLLAHVALYVGRIDEDEKAWLDDLFALRCACRACEPAVRRAAKEHSALAEVYFRLAAGATAENIAAWGRVFGSGCRRLNLYTGTDHSDVPSPAVLNALRSFVVNTQGHLQELTISRLPNSITSTDYALELCRASPQLTSLSLSWPLSSWNSWGVIGGGAIDGLCSLLSHVCPLLALVDLNEGYRAVGGISPTASFQRHFSATKCLEFRGEPDRYAAIEATARACVSADEVCLTECTVLPALVDVLLRTPLRGRLRKLDLSYDTVISNESILQCARGFEALRVLQLPSRSPGTPKLYRSLARLRPTLTSLDLGVDSDANDECLRIICELLSLECLNSQ